MKNIYTAKEFDYFELSPKDNVADYDPLEYMAVVRDSLAQGRLDDYTLPELQKVEKQLSQAYTSLFDEKMVRLSDQEMVKHEDTVHQILFDLVNLQNKKEDEVNEIIHEGTSFLNEVIDTYDAATPENKARKSIGNIQRDLAYGVFGKYGLYGLRLVEYELMEAYSSLSEEEKERYLDSSTQIIMGLTDLQNDTADAGVTALRKDYFKTVKEDLKSWGGFKSGNHKKSKAVEKKEISEEEKDTVEYGLADLIAIHGQEKREPANTPAQNKPAYEEEYSLDALLGKGIVFPAASTSFKAHYVVQPKKAYENVSEEQVGLFSSENSQGIVEMYGLSTRLEELSKLSPVQLKKVVAVKPSRPKQKIASYLATAAIMVGGTLAVFSGYNYLSSSVKMTADHQLNHYHGASSAEATAPVAKAKHSVKAPEVKSVEKESKSVEQPAVAPRATPSAPKKVVKRYPPVWDPYDENLHTVEKGETLAGLYEDYAARGGTLTRAEYFKLFMNVNSHIVGPNTIYAGQVVNQL